jgi:hypothetical protein
LQGSPAWSQHCAQQAYKQLQLLQGQHQQQQALLVVPLLLLVAAVLLVLTQELQVAHMV